MEFPAEKFELRPRQRLKTDLRRSEQGSSPTSPEGVAVQAASVLPRWDTQALEWPE